MATGHPATVGCWAIAIGQVWELAQTSSAAPWGAGRTAPWDRDRKGRPPWHTQVCTGVQRAAAPEQAHSEDRSSVPQVPHPVVSLGHVGLRGARVTEPKPRPDPWPHKAQGSCISWARGGVEGSLARRGAQAGSARLGLQCLAGPRCPAAPHGHCHQEATPPWEEGRASRVQDVILLPGAAWTPGHRVPEAPQVQLAGKWDCHAERRAETSGLGASGHFGGWILCFSPHSFKWFSWL